MFGDDETKTVNPITNIRSDKMELMLDEKIGEYNYKKRKITKKEENKENTEEIKNQENNNNE